MLNKASLTRSPVGLVAKPGTLANFLPLAFPAITRKVDASSPILTI